MLVQKKRSLEKSSGETRGNKNENRILDWQVTSSTKQWYVWTGIKFKSPQGTEH